MKIVVTLSGGMDSTALLYHLKKLGHEVLPISFNYGQRHRRELISASQVSAALGVPHTIVDLTSLNAIMRGSSLTDPSIAVPHGHYADPSMKVTVVPNRNMILLAAAAAYAISEKADALAIAAHAGDHAVYPDCRPEFHEAMAAAFQLCDYNPLQLLRPFIGIDKASIATLGQQAGVPWELTWSCYEGGEVHCGKCGTCVERREAFQVAGIQDPTVYADCGAPSGEKFGVGGILQS